jgi:hypothetical protein
MKRLQIRNQSDRPARFVEDAHFDKQHRSHFVTMADYAQKYNAAHATQLTHRLDIPLMSIGHIERACQVLGVLHRTLRRLRDDRGVSKYARIQEAQDNVYRARQQLMDQLDDPYNLKKR